MISTQNMTFEIGDFRLDAVNIELLSNEYFVLLGPPGSGKSMFLECLCGLRRLTSGTIVAEDRVISRDEPRKRNIGYVPQDYALFPHLTVGQNIAFGLHTPGVNKGKISAKVSETARMLGIDHLLGRSVSGLSGGEKQRTALARALVIEPRVLLLDEPVCALDEATRQNICSLLKRIQRKLELTVVHVSHNLEEAFSVADRAAILKNGKLQQVGPLNQLLRKPANEFVARFMRCENILNACIVEQVPQNDSTRVKVGNLELVVDGLYPDIVQVIIRPEDIVIAGRSDNSCENMAGFRLSEWRDFGSFIKAHLTGPIELIAHIPHSNFRKIESAEGEITISLPKESLHILKEN